MLPHPDSERKSSLVAAAPTSGGLRRSPTRRRTFVLRASSLVAAVACATVVVVELWNVTNPSAPQTDVRGDVIMVYAGENRRLEHAMSLVDAGVADTLVVSNGLNDDRTSQLCQQKMPVEVLCPEPDVLTTRGESRMFAQLAADRGWAVVVLVTGDYHYRRASYWAQKCFDSVPEFSVVDWPRVHSRALIHELFGNLQARFLTMGC